MARTKPHFTRGGEKLPLSSVYLLPKETPSFHAHAHAHAHAHLHRVRRLLAATRAIAHANGDYNAGDNGAGITGGGNGILSQDARVHADGNGDGGDAKSYARVHAGASSNDDGNCSGNGDGEILRRSGRGSASRSTGGGGGSTRKRHVGIFLGYLGWRYKGSQLNMATARGETVEERVMDAVHLAGGILDSNHGHPEKIKWGRASRTDKGVHALANVITLKMECPSSPSEEVEEAPTSSSSASSPSSSSAPMGIASNVKGSIGLRGDFDGAGLASGINKHLPEDIRVFDVVPVTKSFNARRFCRKRTYDFWVPARVLGIGPAGDDEASDKLGNLNAAMRLFEGFHPFHNFTDRRRYMRDKRIQRKNPSPDHTREHNPEPESVLVAFGDMMGWYETYNSRTKLDRSHYRTIHRFCCSSVTRVPHSSDDDASCSSSVLAVKVTVCGDSFMLHQIRHMVGLAVAVSRGIVPADLVPAVLSAPARVRLPLAPPHTLVLRDLAFYPFRDGYGKCSQREDGLQMSDGASKRSQAFCDEAVMPRIAAALEHPDWDAFVEDLDARRDTFPPHRVKDFVDKHASWQRNRENQRENKT